MEAVLKKKQTTILYFVGSYFFAIFIANIFLLLVNTGHLLTDLLVVDIIATLVIYIGSIFIRNASLYDPYWSVAPIAFLYYWLTHSFISVSNFLEIFNLRVILVSIFVITWGIRLTWNWWRGFQEDRKEDWRYANFRANNPKSFWVINLTGIQLMPTLLVFLGSISLFPALTNMESTFGLWDIIGIIICITAILLELFADNQMWKHRQIRQTSDSVNQIGLWKYSRHPNYLGEILFWWGLYCFALSASYSNWWMFIGPFSISMLFIFLSIPMIEKEQKKRKPSYKDYCKNVPVLIPRIIMKRK